ncbi:sigma-54-dependent Fis family transcriptional regulator [Mycobacterium sp. URHB0044]|uniref:sigma-54-dependent Fis family transcriptional regulator n=1 Tax=Mycobacterium sp. URHB0044 TaxID=1380386 RepID=UPI000A8AA56C|nr:helix-turn-helix domain-containing protein [Mycobacterium sp. URHB0044]
MTTASFEGSTRALIETSWRRVAMSGLCPSASVDDAAIEEIDRRSRLMVAATPVLDEMAAELTGTRFAVILADRNALLTDFRFGQERLRPKLHDVGTVEGRRFREETTGTNSIATAFELRRGVAVRGDEHYVESLKRFSCYGQPIIHPVTQRVEGVLDITCLVEDDHPLLAPFVIRSARQVGERLLEHARESERRVFNNFQHAAARARSRPVIAIGDDIFLANAAAMQMVQPDDQAVLRAASVDVPTNQEAMLPIRLVSGREVIASLSPVPGTTAVVITLTDEAAPRRVAVSAGTRTRTLICGEPGSGRTTTAGTMAGAAARWFDCGEVLELGERAWFRRLDECLRERDCVVIESVDTLPAAPVHRMAASIRSATARVILTSVPPDWMGPEYAALLADCRERVDLAALRQRRAEIPLLIKNVLDELGAAPQLRFTPAALEALARHEWPGNFRELCSVVGDVCVRRRVGDVTVADLPESYQSPPRRRLSPIEQAERDAIATALRLAGGNKKAAAQQLGISRTTLYKALRSYGLAAAS